MGSYFISISQDVSSGSEERSRSASSPVTRPSTTNFAKTAVFSAQDESNLNHSNKADASCANRFETDTYDQFAKESLPTSADP